ncbi:cytochrome c, partial [Staphylococcus aureus]|uniref:c-type cytochrome n=1 Tax=Staphylococcus aureus TaxID=1280 RepID=UPI00301D4EE0
TTGEGSPMMTQMVAGINLKSPQARALSDEQMRQQIANGKGAMPPFAGRLTPEQINALVKYIRQEIQGTTAANAR